MQKLMKRLHKNQKGFTLVELMVVVVIIGILVAIAIPIYNTVQATAQKSSCFANQRTLEGAATVFNAESTSSAWPADVDALVNAGYLQNTPVCPLANFGYSLDTNNGKVTGLDGANCDHGHYSGGTW